MIYEVIVEVEEQEYWDSLEYLQKVLDREHIDVASITCCGES